MYLKLKCFAIYKIYTTIKQIQTLSSAFKCITIIFMEHILINCIWIEKKKFSEKRLQKKSTCTLINKSLTVDKQKKNWQHIVVLIVKIKKIMKQLYYIKHYE